MTKETVEGSVAYFTMQLSKYVRETRGILAKYGLDDNSTYEDYRGMPTEAKMAVERELELISNTEIKLANVVFLDDPFREIRDYMSLMGRHGVPEEIKKSVLARRTHRHYLQHYYRGEDVRGEQETFMFAKNLEDVERFISNVPLRSTLRNEPQAEKSKSTT